jgi:hypothetical protein
MGLAGAAIGAGVAGAAVSGITGAMGASNAAGAAKTAASQQAAAYNNAAGLDVQTLSNVAGALTPYTNEGVWGTALTQQALQNGTYQTGTDYLNNATGYLGNAANSYGNATGAYQAVAGDVNSANSIYGQLQNGISEQTLENTPGYQFTLGQGLESTQNSAAARGLGSSGAALKGAATYATGLADQTYQNQANLMLQSASGYQNSAQNELGVGSGYINQGSGYNGLANSSINQQASALDTNNQNFGQLLSGAQLGENAANTYANAATNTMAGLNGDVTGVGNAQASGTVGAANAQNAGLSAIGSSVSGLGSSLTQSLLLQKLLGGTGAMTQPAVGGLY